MTSGGPDSARVRVEPDRSSPSVSVVQPGHTDDCGAGRQVRIVPALLMMLALVVAACSGSEADAPEAAAEATATPEVTAADSAGQEPEDAPEIGDGMFAAVDARLLPNVPALAGSVAVPSFGPTDPIRVGGVVTETIDGLPIRAGICDGAEARLAGAMARSETEYVIEWLGCADDAGFADRTQSAMDRLRFQEPFAIVPLDSEPFRDDELLNAENLPHIGSGTQPFFCGIERGFAFAPAGAAECPVLDVLGLTASGPVLQAWATATGVDTAGLRVAHIVDGSVSSRELARSRALEVTELGAEMVLVDSTIAFAASADDADLAAVAAALLPLNVDVVVVELEGAEAFYPFLAAAGFDGAVVGVELDPNLVTGDPVLATSYVGTFQVVHGLAVVPDASVGWQQLQADAGLVTVDSGPIGRGFVQGYVAMDFFVQALAATAAPVDQLRFHDTINSGWHYPGIEGVACASDWPTAHLVATPCASVVQIDERGILTSMLPPTQFPLLLVDADG